MPVPSPSEAAGEALSAEAWPALGSTVAGARPDPREARGEGEGAGGSEDGKDAARQAAPSAGSAGAALVAAAGPEGGLGRWQAPAAATGTEPAWHPWAERQHAGPRPAVAAGAPGGGGGQCAATPDWAAPDPAPDPLHQPEPAPSPSGFEDGYAAGLAAALRCQQEDLQRRWQSGQELWQQPPAPAPSHVAEEHLQAQPCGTRSLWQAPLPVQEQAGVGEQPAWGVQAAPAAAVPGQGDDEAEVEALLGLRLRPARCPHPAS